MIDEAILRRIVKLEKDLGEGFDLSLPTPYDAAGREMCEAMATRSEKLTQVLADLGVAEQRIADARRVGYTGKEMVQVKQAVSEELLRKTERQRVGRLKGIYSDISDLERRHARERDADPTRSLLHLDRAKLKHASLTEKEAIARIQFLETKGRYREEDLEVLGSRGSKAKLAADVLRRKFPVFVANEKGGALLAEAETVLESHIGDVSYVIEGSPVVQRVKILTLLNGDVRPSAKKFVTIK